MGKPWSIGQRNFCDNWEKRRLIFEAMCKSIVFYGVEIWEMNKFDEIENLKKKYVKWVFGLDKCTPDYLLRREFKERSLHIEAVNRALKYEEKVIEEEGDSMMIEIIRRKELKLGNTSKIDKNREKIIGIYREINCRREKVIKQLEREEEEEDLEKIKYSTYVKEVKDELWNDWAKKDLPKYITEKIDIGVVARLRLGSENRSSKYWMKKEDTKCRLCNKDEETLKHIFEECEVSKINKDVCFIIKEDGRGRGYMRGVIWKRRRNDRDE